MMQKISYENSLWEFKSGDKTGQSPPSRRALQSSAPKMPLSNTDADERQLALLSQLLRLAPARLQFPAGLLKRALESVPHTSCGERSRVKSNPLFLHHYTSLTRILNRNNVDPPAAKIESSPRLNLKRNQTMGKKPDRAEHSRKISASFNRYLSFTPLAAVQPHPPHTCFLHFPRSELPSTPHLRTHSVLNVNLQFFLPLAWLRNSHPP